MTIQLTKTPIGLDGVPAAETALSHVDGEKGELIIAGEHVGRPRPPDQFRRRHGPAVVAGTGTADLAKRKSAPRSAKARVRAFARLPQLLAAARRPVRRRRLPRGDRRPARRARPVATTRRSSAPCP